MLGMTFIKGLFASIWMVGMPALSLVMSVIWIVQDGATTVNLWWLISSISYAAFTAYVFLSFRGPM